VGGRVFFFGKKEAKNFGPLASPETSFKRRRSQKTPSPQQQIPPPKPHPNGQSFFDSFCSQKEDSLFP
jgi:hypothetical protein